MNRRSTLLGLAAVALCGCAALGGAPASTDIVSTAQSNPNLSTLAKLIADADLNSTLKGPGPFTVFAPTNEAFAALPKKTLDELVADKSKLRAVLTYHVLPAKVASADVKPGKVKTVNGGDLVVQRTGDTITLNEDAIVLKADVSASNGVVHVVDRVLIPPKR